MDSLYKQPMEAMPEEGPASRAEAARDEAPASRANEQHHPRPGKSMSFDNTSVQSDVDILLGEKRCSPPLPSSSSRGRTRKKDHRDGRHPSPSSGALRRKDRRGGGSSSSRRSSPSLHRIKSVSFDDDNSIESDVDILLGKVDGKDDPQPQPKRGERKKLATDKRRKRELEKERRKADRRGEAQRREEDRQAEGEDNQEGDRAEEDEQSWEEAVEVVSEEDGLRQHQGLLSTKPSEDISVESMGWKITTTWSSKTPTGASHADALPGTAR